MGFCWSSLGCGANATSLEVVLHRIAAFIIVICTAVLFSATQGRCAEKRSAPNIVFILADDLGWGETGCYGQRKIRTPNIDRLASEGVDSPARTAVRCAAVAVRVDDRTESGPHAPIRGNLEHGEEGQIPLPAAYTTWTTLIHDRAGYATCGIGKWGLGMPNTEGSPLRHGFFHFYGYMCHAERICITRPTCGATTARCLWTTVPRA